MATNRKLHIIYCKIETIVIFPIFSFFSKIYSYLVSYMIWVRLFEWRSMGGLWKNAWQFFILSTFLPSEKNIEYCSVFNLWMLSGSPKETPLFFGSFGRIFSLFLWWDLRNEIKLSSQLFRQPVQSKSWPLPVGR